MGFQTSNKIGVIDHTKPGINIETFDDYRSMVVRYLFLLDAADLREINSLVIPDYIKRKEAEEAEGAIEAEGGG